MKLFNYFKKKKDIKNKKNILMSENVGRYKLRIYKLYERCGLKYD